MAIERTFSMIKPDATKRNLTGAITKMFEDNGLRVVASKRVWMSRRQAEQFYAVHKERPFFGELTEFMSSGPTVSPQLPCSPDPHIKEITGRFASSSDSPT